MTGIRGVPSFLRGRDVMSFVLRVFRQGGASRARDSRRASSSPVAGLLAVALFLAATGAAPANGAHAEQGWNGSAAIQVAAFLNTSAPLRAEAVARTHGRVAPHAGAFDALATYLPALATSVHASRATAVARCADSPCATRGYDATAPPSDS